MRPPRSGSLGTTPQDNAFRDVDADIPSAVQDHSGSANAASPPGRARFHTLDDIKLWMAWYLSQLSPG